MLLKASHIFKTKQHVDILNDVSLALNASEIVAITGPSGAGKTTLLNILGTLEQPDKHPNTSLEFDGRSLLALNEQQLAEVRNQSIGFIFQHHGLLEEFTALENICLPGLIMKTPQKLVQEYAHELLDTLGLSHRSNHKPQALSGGEKQRIAVARALINHPKLVLADEPSGNLDSPNALQLHELFHQLVDQLKCSFLVVTHNQEIAQKSDRILVLRDGKME